MKKFKFKIHGNDYDVDILNVEGSTAEIEVNGTKYEVEIDKKMAQPITPKLVRSRVQPPAKEDKPAPKTKKPAEKKGAGVIKAPLPGTVLSTSVKEGDSVKAGDVLLILEAMKMENSIKADMNGVVEKLSINAGDSVLEGDVLVEIGGE